MIPAAFAYVRPASVEEALAALADPEAKAIAGGHSLVPMMKLRFARPGTLVDLSGLPLRGVRDGDGAVRIGALTTYDELLRRDPRIELPDALAEAAASVGDLQVRNAGTIGGALAHGDPASDLAAAVLALEARLVLRSRSGDRECAAADFFQGPYTTALAQQELLVEVVVPAPAAGSGSAYASLDDPASGYPLVGVAAVAGPGGALRLGVTGAGGTPFAAGSVDAVLEQLGAPADEDEEYARQLASVVAHRAVETARNRAGAAR